MKTRALDSWPIVEWIVGRQPAGAAVMSLLDEASRGEARLFMSAINVGEVYYFLRKQHSVPLAEYWRELSRKLPIRIEVPTLDEFWSAALLKGAHPISYADRYAAAIAQKYGCPLITGDPELRRVDGLVLDWIGP